MNFFELDPPTSTELAIPENLKCDQLYNLMSQLLFTCVFEKIKN